MILNALYQYYERKSMTDNPLPLYGTEIKQIGFNIIIDENGKFIDIEDCSINNKESLTCIVNVGGTNTAKDMYGNMEYLFGITGMGECGSKAGGGYRTEKEADERMRLFINRINELSNAHPDVLSFKAITRFYHTYTVENKKKLLSILMKNNAWDKMLASQDKAFSNISFKLIGERDNAAEIIARFTHPLIEMGDERCLVTGKLCTPVKTFPAINIKGPGINPKLISFQKKSGFDSFGKKQGENAPISKDAAFKCMTALNSLLSEKSLNKFIIGKTTYVFWTSDDSVACNKIESGMSCFQKMLLGKSNSIDKVNDIREVFNAIYTGNIPSASNERFYVLGLLPNSSRVSIVYWSDSSVKEFASNIMAHFDDMSIIGGKATYTSIYSILRCSTKYEDINDKVPSNLVNQLITSIFCNTQYPYELYTGCVNKIKSTNLKHHVFASNASFIKAFINRLNNRTMSNKIGLALDQANNNPAYLCGRLFAIYTKMEEDARTIMGETPMSNIYSSFLNMASTHPSGAFMQILKKVSYYMKKLPIQKKMYYDKLARDVVNMLGQFPVTLQIIDQGTFMEGYYHQRSAFFAKKDEDTEKN